LLEAHSHTPRWTTGFASSLPRAQRLATRSLAPRTAWILWAAILVLGAVFTALIPLILPARFFYDSAHIAKIAQDGLAAGQGDRSFIAVGELYNILRLQDSPQLVAVVSFLALAGAHTSVLFTALRERAASATTMALLTVSLGLTSVYLTTYSKDAVVLMVAGAVLLSIGHRAGDLLIVGATVLYALCFRDYWFIVALAYVAIRVADRWVRRPLLLLAPLALVVVIALGYSVMTGGSITSIRDLANALRTNSPDAHTLIPHYLDLVEPWNGMLNSALTVLLLVLPVPLVLLGGAYYVAIALLLFTLWASVAFGWLRRPAGRAGVIGSRALALILAFLTAQAMFEPDYGSALRHLAPLLPVLVLGVAMAYSSHSVAVATTRSRRRGRHSA
jgi:hypothetical protein